MLYTKVLVSCMFAKSHFQSQCVVLAVREFKSQNTCLQPSVRFPLCSPAHEIARPSTPFMLPCTYSILSIAYAPAFLSRCGMETFACSFYPSARFYGNAQPFRHFLFSHARGGRALGGVHAMVVFPCLVVASRADWGGRRWNCITVETSDNTSLDSM